MTKTTTIHASTKLTPQIKGVYYSFEYGEERTVSEDANLEEERRKLFDDCFNTVAEQINEVRESYK